VLKGKCTRLLDDASVLTDKLSAERGRTTQLRGLLQHSQACLEAQQQRTHRAMQLLLTARNRHDGTLEVLEATFAQAKAAAASESEAKLAAAAAQEQREREAVLSARLRMQLASVSARSEELQSAFTASEARMQVLYLAVAPYTILRQRGAIKI